MGDYTQKERVRIEVLNTREENGRFHQDAELLYILEGNMDVQVLEYRTKLPPEGIYIVDGGKKYSYTASDTVLFVRVTVPTQLLCRVNQVAEIIFWCDSTREDTERYNELRRVLKHLLNRHLSTADRDADFGYMALCYQLLDLLSTGFLVMS